MLDIDIKDTHMEFETTDEVFSPKNADRGTLAMLRAVDFNEDDKVLDLGCGYGLVGIYAAKNINPSHVVMCDVNEKAVELVKDNLQINNVEGVKLYESDGLKEINESGFSLILSNPPYHADFSVPKKFIEKGFNRLKMGGKMYMVTKRKEWYKNKLIAIFGGVKIKEDDGYYIFTAVKKSESYANDKHNKKDIKQVASKKHHFVSKHKNHIH